MSFKPTAIVLHVSASTWGTARDIDAWHKARGWKKIGYHFVVCNGFARSGSYVEERDGTVEQGRGEFEQGAHCAAGGMNSRSLGVCCIGNPGWAPPGPDYLPAGLIGRTVKRSYMTRRQHAELIALLARLCRRHGISPDQIHQHSDFDNLKPMCASLNMQVVRKAVKQRLAGS